MFFIFKIQGLFMLELITLAVGCVLLMKAHKEECCRKFYKAVAYFIIVVSILTMICTGYHATRLVCEYKHSPHGMMGMPERMGDGECTGTGGMGMGGMGMRGMEGGMGMMMKEMMKECPMMKDCPMMKKMMEEEKAETSPSGEKK